MTIEIGKHVRSVAENEGPRIVCDAAALKTHVNRPWFRAYVADRLGVPLGAPSQQEASAVTVSDADLARHTLACGVTGTGKSRLLLHLITAQLDRGASAVVIDPKGETVDRLIAHALARGVPPERVILLDPRAAAGIPGWNPLSAGVPLTQAVADFVTLLAQSTTSWGPRLQDLLTNALLLVGSHGLSLYELARFLVGDDYRAGLLRQPAPGAEPIVYGEVRRFFIEEFEAWSRSDRVQAVAPVLNKVRELLRSPFLRPLLCARRNTLDLARLWQQPQLVLVRLDRTALGEDGARLLAGLFCHALLQTALRVQGPVPVLLAIDELPMLERFVGRALGEIVAIARSQQLRLLVAWQHLAQVSDELRSALLANTAVQLFFQMGYTDAKLVAASLAAGSEPRVVRLTASVDREEGLTGLPELTYWRHPIRDPFGRRLQIPAAARRGAGSGSGRVPLSALPGLTGGAGRLYVHAADTGAPVELSRYVAKLTATDFWIEGPRLTLVVAFPRPRLTGVERWSESDAVRDWAGRLQALPLQHAALRLAGHGTGVLRVVDVPTPAISPAASGAYISRAMGANGQSRPEIEATLAEREAAVERLAHGRATRQEVDDGSIA
jgi:hypothetical protein